MENELKAREKPVLGLIAGSGLLPGTVADLYANSGGKVYVAIIDDELGNFPLSNHRYKQFSIGSVGKILAYFTENNVSEIVMIGAVKRPDLTKIKPDLVGSVLLAKILKQKFLGDDNLLKTVAKFIESKGFRVISPKTILNLNIYSKLYNTVNQPREKDKEDIQLGIKLLTSLGNMDVGQSVIVENGCVLGIEAAEGTDNLIRRCEMLRKAESGGVLVKMPKANQDLRLDLPTIGPDTAFYLAKHGYNGLAVAEGSVLIVEPQKTIDILDANNLFLSYLY